MRASHVIKGASSNLMCEQLRETSLHLEQAASSANDIDSQNTQALEIATATVREKLWKASGEAMPRCFQR